jgi:hypothetical protein
VLGVWKQPLKFARVAQKLLELNQVSVIYGNHEPTCTPCANTTLVKKIINNLTWRMEF